MIPRPKRNESIGKHYWTIPRRFDREINAKTVDKINERPQHGRKKQKNVGPFAKSSKRSGKKHAARSSSSFKLLKKYCILFFAIFTVFQPFLDEFQLFKKFSGMIRARETQNLKEFPRKCFLRPPADPTGRVCHIFTYILRYFMCRHVSLFVTVT